MPGVGPIALNRLLAEFGGDPRAILATGRFAAWRTHFDLAREEERMAQSGADFIIRGDDPYPKLLKEIHDPPIGLYRRGGCDFKGPSIAIIGSRRTTLYGISVAKSLGAELGRMGFCIVSGLARGIDTAAHEGALSAGGKTAAVIGTGMDSVYPPENLDLFRQIAGAGAVLSEFPFGRRADRRSFPRRNRIVSGICEATIVVESDVDGGAMITAQFAGEQGRLIFAVPGRIDQPTSAGCHQLIRDGATLLTSVNDVLSELNYLPGFRSAAAASGTEKKARPASLSEDENLLLGCLQGGEILSPDMLAEMSGLPASRLSSALMMLEIKRAIARRLDGRYESAS